MNFDGYFSLGLTYEQKLMFYDAAECYRKAIEIDPHNFSAHARLGFALYNRRQMDEAASCLKQALNLNPSYDEAYICLGMIHRETGRFDDAISYFRKALQINPDSSWVYTNLGATLQCTGQYEEGLRYLVRAWEKNHNIQNPPISVRELLVGGNGVTRGEMLQQRRAPKKILIVVSVFNRKKITALSLKQTRRYMSSHCYLQVYNDHSTEYDNNFLTPYADEVTQLPEKMGIDKLRWIQFRKFLDTDYDYLYLTDNDVIHDPGYIDILDRLYEKGKGHLPVSLFHNIFMLQPRLLLYYRNGILLKTSAPGASMFFDRKMVETILHVSDNIGDKLDYLPWDNRAVACLRLPWITPEMSYVEHFGGGGLHSDNDERERAVNATEYLRARRDRVLVYLRQDNGQEPDL